MHNIAIISASIRTGRMSHRVAIYFKKLIEEKQMGQVTMLDLADYDFPVFHERLNKQENPDAKTLDFADKFKAADGILIVTPEYNGGYPAALKNVTDLFTTEWKRKPVAISTVSSGQFGGMQVITSIQYSLWKLHALTVAELFPVPKVQDAFNEHGLPADKEGMDKRAMRFLEELLWYMGKSRGG